MITSFHDKVGHLAQSSFGRRKIIERMNGSNGRVVKGGYSNQKVVSLDLLRFVLFD